MTDIPHQFQGQKVKVQGEQAALGGCSSLHLQGAGAHIVAVALQAATACCSLLVNVQCVQKKLLLLLVF